MFGLSKLEGSLIMAVVAIICFGVWLVWNDHEEIAKGRAQVTSQIAAQDAEIDKQVAQQTADLKSRADMADRGAQSAQEKLAQYKLDHPDTGSVFVQQHPGCEGSRDVPKGPTTAANTESAGTGPSDDGAVQIRTGSTYDVGPGYALLVSVAEQLAIDEAQFQGRSKPVK